MRMKKAPRSLLVLLVAAMASGPLFGYALSASSAALIDHVGISAGQLGWLASISFVSAAVGSLGFGRLADRIGLSTQLVFIHGSSIISLVLAAAATDYWVLVLAAVFAGLPLATSNPTTNRILARQVPPAQRSSWIGTKQSGVQAAQLFCGLFFPAMTLWLGWAGAALGAAVIVGVLLVQSLTTLRAHPESTPSTEDSSASQGDAAAASSQLPSTVWFLAGISLLSGAGMQATNVYLPLFAVESLGYGLVVGGLTAGLTGTVGVVSRILWSRRLQTGAKPTTLLLIIFVGAVASGLALLVANLTGIRVLLWVGTALLGASTLGVNVVVNATLLRVMPRARVGSATGVTSMGMFAGFAAGPIIMGAVRDLTGDFWLGWAIVAALYATAFILTVILRVHHHTTRHA